MDGGYACSTVHDDDCPGPYRATKWVRIAWTS
jgi:hypothetical protein